MIKTSLLPVVTLILLCSRGWAQRVQNMDIYFLAGPAPSSSMTIPDADVTVNKSTGVASAIGYGYQVARISAASIWLDLAQTSVVDKLTGANIRGLINNDFISLTAGLRFMMPLQSRISVYGTLGGGWAYLNYPAIERLTIPLVTSTATTHGVFQCGGGVDLRLTQRFSIRGEVRDIVTGRGLSGSTGPHHVVPLMGVAFHF